MKGGSDRCGHLNEVQDIGTGHWQFRRRSRRTSKLEGVPKIGGRKQHEGRIRQPRGSCTASLRGPPVIFIILYFSFIHVRWLQSKCRVTKKNLSDMCMSRTASKKSRTTMEVNI